MTNDIQVPHGGPFPDDQDPDQPFYVNKTLGAMSRIKSVYQGGRWLYAKNMNDDEVRAFYKAPENAPVERQGDTVAVWVSEKSPEPKYPAFDAPTFDPKETRIQALELEGHRRNTAELLAAEEEGSGVLTSATTVEATVIAARQASLEAQGHRPAVATLLAEPDEKEDPEEERLHDYWMERAKRAEKGMMEEMRLRLRAQETLPAPCSCGRPEAQGLTHTAKSCMPTHWAQEAAYSRQSGPAPKPVPAFTPSRDVEGTLRTCGMKLFELIENVQGAHKDEAHKLLILSNEIHAMAARFELGRLREGMKRK